jgi:hypothetical protein
MPAGANDNHPLTNDTYEWSNSSMSSNNKKRKIIDELLNNPVYLSESGLIKDLSKALYKLSEKTLTNLLVVLSLKH